MPKVRMRLNVGSYDMVRAGLGDRDPFFEGEVHDLSEESAAAMVRTGAAEIVAELPAVALPDNEETGDPSSEPLPDASPRKRGK